MLINILVFILLAVAVVLSVIAGIWILVAAFRTHIFWGLGLLFFPVVGLIFVILHWDDVKTPFFMNLGATVLFAAVFFMTMRGASAPVQAVVEGGSVAVPSVSITEKWGEIKQAASQRKARAEIAGRGFLGRPLAEVEAELGTPQGTITRAGVIEYQYIDKGITLISSNGVTVTDEIHR